MDYEAMKFWFDTAQFGLTCLIGVYVWMSNRSKANQKAIDRVSDQVKRLDDRIMLCEQNIKHLPDQKDIAQINSQLTRLHGDLQKVDGRLTGINRAVDLMYQNMLGEHK